jgi:hypothetical protein
MQSKADELIDHIKTFESIRESLQKSRDLMILPDIDIYRAFDDLEKAIKALDSEILILRRRLRLLLEKRGDLGSPRATAY